MLLNLYYTRYISYKIRVPLLEKTSEFNTDRDFQVSLLVIRTSDADRWCYMNELRKCYYYCFCRQTKQIEIAMSRYFLSIVANSQLIKTPSCNATRRVIIYFIARNHLLFNRFDVVKTALRGSILSFYFSINTDLRNFNTTLDTNLRCDVFILILFSHSVSFNKIKSTQKFKVKI